MLQRLRTRAEGEQGFTLIELLVVILIIGILAAIALPTFLGQQKKGQDASAKSDARNLVTHVESCFADTEDYTACDNSKLGTTGLTLAADDTVPAAGAVSVISEANSTSYVVEASSKSGNHFFIAKVNGAGPLRYCDTAGDGGCKTGTPTGAPAGTGTW